MECGRYEEASQCLKQSIMMEANYPPTLVQMGNLLFEAGNLDKAEKYYTKAFKCDQSEARAISGLANILQEQN